MESFKTLFRKLFHNFSSKVSIYASIILVCAYHVLDRDMACTCKPGRSGCASYIVMPCFIIFFIVLCIDMSFQRACRFTCRRDKIRCRMLNVLLRQVLQAVCVGLLWALSVLIDADWFVCCWNDESPYQAALACKDKTNKTSITLEDQAIIAELKNKSRDIGLGVVLSITFLAAFFSSVDWFRCSSCCPKQVKTQYHELILEEKEIEITNYLKEAAKKKVNERIKVCVASEDWTTISDVADYLIEASPYTPVPQTEPESPQSAGEVGIPMNETLAV